MQKMNKGDIFKLGKHRLMCGDSNKKRDIKILMDGKKADMVFTDPPYFNFGSSSGKTANNADFSMVEPFFRTLAENISENLKSAKGAFICCDWRTYPILYQIFNEYLCIKNCIIWDTQMLKMGVYFRSMHEFILYAENSFIDQKAYGAFTHSKIFHTKIRTDIANIWHVPDNNFRSKNKLHSSQKPLDLVKIALESYAEEPAELVLDLFGGSGSIMTAAFIRCL